MSASASRKYVLFGAFTALSLVLDQWTKALARTHLRPLGPFNPKVVIEGFFNLRYSENPGVAFGMLQQMPGGRLVLTLLAVAAIVLVLAYLRRTEPDADAQGGVGDVEGRPLVRLDVPHDEVGDLTEGDAIDQVADGAATDEPERDVQPELARP